MAVKKFLYLLLGFVWFTGLPTLADTLTEQGSQTKDNGATRSTTQGSDGDC
jgi:hypothetical protein